MPELPEVEIVRRGLEPVLLGRRIVRAEQRRKDLRFPFPDGFVRRLEGRTATLLRRRAKYLMAYLDSGEVLVMHLGMSGRFTVGKAGGSAGRVIGDYEYETGSSPKHDHVVFAMEKGVTITYNDPRRFGFMLLLSESELETHPLFVNLGVEPLGNQLSADYLAKRALGRKTDLKAFLMDQRNVAGLGNIYVCEALFRAGLSPLRKASSLAVRGGGPTDRAERLVPAIRSVLAEALDAGGSTLKDYRQADGSRGAFQEAHSVYDRDGERCVRKACRGTVMRLVQGQRSTFYCKVCQR